VSEQSDSSWLANDRSVPIEQDDDDDVNPARQGEQAMSEQFKIEDRVMITGKIDAISTEVNGNNQAYGYRVKIAGVFQDYSVWMSPSELHHLPPSPAPGEVKLTQAQAERRQYEMDVAKHLYADLAQMSAKRAKELARDLANEFFGNKDGKGGKE
jgi:hypothetical protein